MQDKSLLDYWLILYERRVVILLVIAASIVSAVVIGLTMPPVYEARAALYIPAKLAPVSYVSGTSTSSLAREQGVPLSKETDYKPYLGILKSEQLAEIVHAQYPKKSVVKLMRSDTDFEVTDELVVRVYSRDHDPKLAADIANAYVDGLNTILVNNSQAQVTREPASIQSALGRINGEIQNAASELTRFEEKYQLVDLSAEQAALSARKDKLSDKADDTLEQIAAIRAKKTALVRGIKREGEDLRASDVAVTSPLIVTLRGQLADVLTNLSELEGELGNHNLQLMALRKRKQELEQQLGGEIRHWLSSPIKPESSHLEQLRQQLIDVVIEEQRLQAIKQANVRTLARLKARLRAYPEIKARGAKLNATLDRLRKMQDQLQTNLTEAKLQNDRQMHLVVKLDHAEPPGFRAFPIWWLNILVALFSGTLAGVGYVLFLNYVEETRNVRTVRLARAILRRN